MPLSSFCEPPPNSWSNVTPPPTLSHVPMEHMSYQGFPPPPPPKLSYPPMHNVTYPAYRPQPGPYSLSPAPNSDVDFRLWEAPETPQDRQCREQTLMGTLNWGDPDVANAKKPSMWNDELRNRRNQKLPNKTPAIRPSSTASKYTLKPVHDTVLVPTYERSSFNASNFSADTAFSKSPSRSFFDYDDRRAISIWDAPPSMNLSQYLPSKSLDSCFHLPISLFDD